jgi:hypothetical protein
MGVLAQDGDQWLVLYENNDELSGCIEVREFLGQLSKK